MNKNPIRIIPILDIKNGLLIKGINLEGLRVLGKASNFSNHYYQNGADEICYIDNVATLYGTNNLSKFITETAKKVFIPLLVGGGIKNVNDIKKTLAAGADKVCINSSAIENISLIKKASRIFGSSNITIIIQCIKIENKYYICKSNGRDLIKIDPVSWAKKVQDFGAGEIILTCINNEGLKKGFDIKITKEVSEKVEIPVIAHGGAGSFKDIYEVIKHANVSGVGLASILHYEAINCFPRPNIKIGNTKFLETLISSNKRRNIILEIKNYLKSKKIKIRND